MNSRTIFYTANAGFFLTVNDITLAVDAFPRIADRGFSALSQSDFESLSRWSDLVDVRYVIATHNHSDHYSKRWTEQFLAAHPKASFIGGVSDDRAPRLAGTDNHTYSILLRGDRPTYYLPGITLEFLRLPHEGAEFADVNNYGCLITFPASGISAPNNGISKPYRVLFLGDAKPADPAIADWISGRPIDLALLNFPWIALPKGRRFINEYLPNARIAVLHLPYEQDDRNHYCAATRKATEQINANGNTVNDTGKITLLTEFGQVLHF